MAIKMHMPPLTSVRGQTLLTDTKPYLFRQSPVVAEMLDDMLTGGTVAWNQQIVNGDFADTTNWKTQNAAASLSVAGGVATLTLTSGSWNAYTPAITQITKVQSVTGHKYAVFAQMNLPVSTNVYWANSAFGTPYIFGTGVQQAGAWLNLATIRNATASAEMIGYIGINAQSAQIGDSFKIRNIHIHDLTQMFGATIADYVYSLEQSTAGSGIAWLRSFGFFTADYYPYDAGSLLSVKTSGHKTVKNGVEHTYPLSDIELRGIPKLTDGQMYYDGDTYKSDGTVTRKWGVLTLDGSENWYVRDGKTNEFVVRTATDAFVINSSTQTTVVGIVASRFANATWAVYNIQAPDKTVSLFYGQPWIIFRDTSFSDVASWKTSLSTNPITVAYMLKEPTTETTTPFTNPQQAGSTEEYLDTRTVPMPVGHTTEYFNMVQKEHIQMHMPTHSPIKMHMPKV